MATFRHCIRLVLLVAASAARAEDMESRFRAVMALPPATPGQEREVLRLLRDMPENPTVLALWQAGAEARGETRFAGMVRHFAAEALLGERLADPPVEDGVETAEFRMACDRIEACGDLDCRADMSATLRRLLESPPHAAAEAIQLAGLYRGMGEALPAAVCARHALRAGSTNEQVRAAYFADLQALGLREVELREWERWTDAEKATPAQLQGLARRMLDLGAANQAKAWVHRWVRRQPENGTAWLWSGRTALANQDLDGAEQDFAQALRTQADPLPAWMEMARLNALRRDPEQTKVWLGKVQTRLREEDYVDFLMDPAFGKVPEIMLGL
jgi:tetratricopeptide (TPR) repeat protein